MQNIDLVKAMVKLTGGHLPEVVALTVHDIVPAEYSNITIHIGMGKQRRSVFIHDDQIPLKLLDAAIANNSDFLFANAVPNFDTTPERAMFAKRQYSEYAHNSNEDYDGGDSEQNYDALALKLVARTMGISVKDVVYLLEQ